jgi:hypothetical protein
MYSVVICPKDSQPEAETIYLQMLKSSDHGVIARNGPVYAGMPYRKVFLFLSFISALTNTFVFPVGSQLEYRAPFRVSVITHTLRHMVGLLWTSDQPIAEASTYTEQHNI